MNDITLQSRLAGIAGADLTRPTIGTTKTEGPAFADVLKGAIQDVNRMQADADEAIKGVQLGEDIDIHDAMLALNKADTSFKLLMEVRNKLLKAYDEVMRTQL
jgi:flagellar hook-basal body complex protein FliE